MNPQISSFYVMELLKRANALEAQGRKVFHLEAGQPDSGAPPAVVAAAQQALATDRLGYVDALGLVSLRERIASYLQTAYGITVGAERVIVTTGSSAGFVLGFLASLQPGSRVGMTAPYYPAQPNILRALGFEPVILETSPDEQLQLTLPLLNQRSHELDALIVASPANPTGAMLDAATLQGIVAHCAAQDIVLFSDEIYHGICYGERAHSALEFGESPIVINSFSKYFSMTGWRLGWLVVPPELVDPIEKLSQNLYISSPVLAQRAALAAFDELPALDAHVQRYARNRALLMDALPGLGYEILARPEGAFYLYTALPDGETDALDYCLKLLQDTGVSVTPGNDFDRGDRARSLRFSYAAATAVIEDALTTLATHRPRSAATQ